MAKTWVALRMVWNLREFIFHELEIIANKAENGCTRKKTLVYGTLYGKRDVFDFAIVNFPFLCSNVSLSPAYSVYVMRMMIFNARPTTNQKVDDAGL